jgi:MarR family transcriptional regulator for hemolysin
MPTQRPEALRAFTGELIRLARTYRREVDRSIREHGLSDARAVPVLQIARAGGGMRQGVLAEELGMEGPSLVRLLDQICAAGLVERRDDPRDRRAKTLHVTPAGLDLAATLKGLLGVLRSRLMAEVSDEDLAASLRTFAALGAALDAAEAKAKAKGT